MASWYNAQMNFLQATWIQAEIGAFGRGAEYEELINVTRQFLETPALASFIESDEHPYLLRSELRRHYASAAALIGNMARRLAERPDVDDTLRGRRELMPRFVEEVARLDAPFNFHYRLVQRDCKLAGFELHSGDRLMLLWASANRDLARVDDPDELRLDRKHPKDHITFGRGAHFCIGAPIARLEARIVCEELLDATHSIARRPDAEPVYASSIMVRRLEHLPLDAQPATNVPT